MKFIPLLLTAIIILHLNVAPDKGLVGVKQANGKAMEFSTKVLSEADASYCGYMGGGLGWAGANYVTCNCRGELICQSPPDVHLLWKAFLENKEIITP